ncbi:MAG: hypothetical protein ACPG8W_07595 [Candidatus Promineifilaceae bacterium]
MTLFRSLATKHLYLITGIRPNLVITEPSVMQGRQLDCVWNSAEPLHLPKGDSIV